MLVLIKLKPIPFHYLTKMANSKNEFNLGIIFNVRNGLGEKVDVVEKTTVN
jgi:hypothetical protein